MLNEFGGDWTIEKLECLSDYLLAYVKILRKKRYFRISYVDAFAGSGYISHEKSRDKVMPLFEEESGAVSKYLEGSTRIALSIYPGFDQYIFIEKNKKMAKALEKLREDYPEQSEKIQIINSDANEYLTKWCAQKEFWQNNRAVVFLDPFGMEVKWQLLQSIAMTRAIDLWILFPVFGVNRMLTKGKQPPELWSDLLTNFFGTEEWKSSFYKTQTIPTLFGEEEATCKSSSINEIGLFFLDRLKTIFPHVISEPLILCNSRNNPLFLLCFAASNPTKGQVAVKIAHDIINKKTRETKER